MLDLLKVEFPDVTISKIRFLESQGLLDPERTASGYRKFYQVDVERLRWILRQQRENFLPLKVIKDRLEAEGVSSGPSAAFSEKATGPASSASDQPGSAPDAPPSSSSSPPAPTPPAPTPPAPTPPAPTPPPAPPPPAPPASQAEPAPIAAEVEATPETFSREELARASGLSPSDLSQLERHGLLVGTSVGSQLCYDSQSLEVARVAAAFAHHGVEPRHLKMYKNSAEREVGFYEQVVLPLIKQRNPAARAQALATLDELAALGDALRSTLRRQALRSFDAEPPKVRRRS
jgi:DNA-binding transcriptional MerR regulator